MANTETDCPFEVGAYAIFKGYGEGAEGELVDGEVVKILEVNQDDEGVQLAVESVMSGTADSAFYPEEVEEAATEDEVAAATAETETETEEAEAPAAKAPAKTTAKKAPAKTAAKPAAKTAAKPAAKTAAKKTTAPKANLPAKTKAAGKATDTKAKGNTKAEPEVIEIIDIAAVTEAIEEGEDALGAAEMLAQRAEMTFYTLGGVLLHISRDGLHRDVEDKDGNPYEEGSKGFNRYVSEELGLEYRKARYYMDMYQHFTHLGVDEEVVVSVGWTKAREIVKIADKAKALEAFEQAKDLTRDELVDYVKEVTVEADKSAGKKTTSKTTTEGASSKAKKTRFSFSAFEEQGQIVQDALTKAGEIIGSDDIAEQFQHIVTEWSMTSGNVEVPLEDAIDVLQSTYGVEITVAEPEEQPAPAPAKGKTRAKAKAA